MLVLALADLRLLLRTGDSKDIAATDAAVLELFPENDHWRRRIRVAQECHIQIPMRETPA